MRIREYHLGDEPEPDKMNRLGMVGEWKSIFQLGRLALNYSALTKDRKEDDRPIILFPGFLSTESSMLPMKHFLKRLGYNSEYWGLGINKGHIERYRDLMVQKIVEENKKDVVLIGWSVGGVIAREVARTIPDSINSVFTFGAPIKGPQYTIGYDIYPPEEIDRLSNLRLELDKTHPIKIPMTILFSKKDKVVSWPSCLDEVSPNARHFQVSSTHLSMVLDPDVWFLLAKHLEINA